MSPRSCMDFLLNLITGTLEPVIYEFLQFLVGLKKARPPLHKVRPWIALSLPLTRAPCPENHAL